MSDQPAHGKSEQLQAMIQLIEIIPLQSAPGQFVPEKVNRFTKFAMELFSSKDVP